MVAAPVAGIGDGGCPGSSAFAEPLSPDFGVLGATADESAPATGTSGKIPSAVSSTHAVQSPLGASEKILAPHLRQALITLIIARDSACVPILYCVKFCRALFANHSNQITQLVFDIAGSRNGIGNFFAQ